jgi:hypothetical protein
LPQVKYGVRSSEFIWLHVQCMLHSLAKTPQSPPPPHPPHLGSYTRTLLVSQDRRHIYVTPCYWRILKKTVVYSGFKNPDRKIRETRKLDKNSSREKTRVYAQKHRLKIPFKNFISGHESDGDLLFTDICVALLLGYLLQGLL